ncbi:argininosuccinate lyase [Acetobacteraceae bacterium H6797]|nr:argininosuccinate lyase [Acetobacteraceae bacterium H6797]
MVGLCPPLPWPEGRVYGRPSRHRAQGERSLSEGAAPYRQHGILLTLSSHQPAPSTSNQAWGGRYSEGPSAIMQAINASIGFDRKLWRQDIRGSLAHAAMLKHVGIISADDEAAIRDGLNQIAAEIEAGEFTFSEALEDIHMNVEARLTERIGEAGKRLHTGRSRNDQVALDMRLWVRDAIDGIDGQIADLMRALVDRADEHAATVMPGFTHLQPAQPTTLGHHLLAYVEMLGRDRARLADCRARMNESPLGAAALCGTGFPIDRHMTAAALGFDQPMRNSLDAVASRDFSLEFLSTATICGTHLSRFAEEIVLWTNPYFGFVKLSDAFTTGSSIMPQKRNPDAAELVRAKVGRIAGALVGLMTVMKGLPLTYGKDMQEDKEGLFDATEALALGLAATAGMVRDMQPDGARLKAAAGAGFSTATDLADWLVRELRLPFRDAHHVTGRLVAKADAKGIDLSGLSLEEMQAEEPRIHNGIYSVLTVEASVASRTSYGGTAPVNVRRMAGEWRERLK